MSANDAPRAYLEIVQPIATKAAMRRSFVHGRHVFPWVPEMPERHTHDRPDTAWINGDVSLAVTQDVVMVESPCTTHCGFTPTASNISATPQDRSPRAELRPTSIHVAFHDRNGADAGRHNFGDVHRDPVARRARREVPPGTARSSKTARPERRYARTAHSIQSSARPAHPAIRHRPPRHFEHSSIAGGDDDRDVGMAKVRRARVPLTSTSPAFARAIEGR